MLQLMCKSLIALWCILVTVQGKMLVPTFNYRNNFKVRLILDLSNIGISVNSLSKLKIIVISKYSENNHLQLLISTENTKTLKISRSPLIMKAPLHVFFPKEQDNSARLFSSNLELHLRLIKMSETMWKVCLSLKTKYLFQFSW